MEETQRKKGTSRLITKDSEIISKVFQAHVSLDTSGCLFTIAVQSKMMSVIWVREKKKKRRKKKKNKGN